MSGSSPAVPLGGGVRIHFPAELPISARVPDIARAITENQVVIVVGATGSGKTTQLPKVALELGRGSERRIGVTQPRRIAATSVAARVAQELGTVLGNEVGYQIRFEDKSGPKTRVKFMTDGVLLAETQGDRLLRRYDTLIIDEAHERSLNIDFLLGWLKRILPERPDLKMLVSSATIEAERFASFFSGAPIVQVEGRTYPVDVLYDPPDPELDFSEAVGSAVGNVAELDNRGDILVFLPGEREIREVEQVLAARRLRQTEILPLYARLSGGDQRKVFATTHARRIILATNVAETSLTLPGIVYVIDAGLARLSRYDPRTGTTRLQVEAISKASAEQRKGRAGRVREGICVRLYDEQSFVTRPDFTDPEMKRVGLAGVILRMKSLGLGAVEDFPFLDAPNLRSINEGYRVLEELGALDEERELTQLGQRLARLPVDPRVGRMILAGVEYGCLNEVLVCAAALNVLDPRERPRGLEQKADQLHRRFADQRSDFAGLLKLWEFVKEAQQKSTGQLRRTCKDNFLSFVRVREWMDVERQLADIVRELELTRGRRERPHSANATKGEQDVALHKALLSGLLSRIGMYNAEQRVYLGARQTRFALHPSSALAKKAPAWVMAFELVETTQLFARTVAKLEPEWLDEVGHHLLKRNYSEPHWSEKSARASVREHATLFGLPVLRDRSVDYSTLAPGRARLMFIEHALVRDEYQSKGAFQAKNRALVAEVERLRDKARKSAMLADDEARLAFFEKRLPESVVNGKTFEAWRELAEKKTPHLLELSLADVLGNEPPLVPERYPDSLSLHGVQVPLSYRFDPSAEDDGVTLTLPLGLLPALEPGELDWTIPAWHEERILALLETLPKAQRKGFGALPELAGALAQRLVAFSGPLLPALARAVSELTKVEVFPEAFRSDEILPYLRFTFRVLGERGKGLAQGRDLSQLAVEHGTRARDAFERAATDPTWHKSELLAWSFGTLPAFVLTEVLGTHLRAYPTLLDRGSSVELTLVESPAKARALGFRGVRRLLAFGARGPLSVMAKRAPPPFARRSKLPPSRAEADAFTGIVLTRVVEQAFALKEDGELPRNKQDFERLLASGIPRIEPAFNTLAQAIKNTAAELEKTLRALDGPGQQPSATLATRDIRAQLELLFPNDLLETLELERLQHFSRYLRAAQTRLTRAISDPRKDADKLAPFTPLWQSFLSKQRAAQDQDAARSLRWVFEEWRVAIFAPELKPAQPVTVASVERALAALR